MLKTFRLFSFLIFACLGWCAAALGQTSASQLAWQAASKVAIYGPSDTTLGDQAILHIPRGMAFIPKPEAAALMAAWGNSSSPGFFGLIVADDSNSNWVMTIEHTAEGYVKDDEAKSWNPDELLQSLRDGTEEQNKERVKMNIPAMDIVGWIEPPSYDVTTHRLAWSLKAVDRGGDKNAPATVNYNTYALGRDGYFQVNLLTSDAFINNEKSYARTVLSSLEYKAGKKYEDFNESTDHIAEYGLAALIGGVAAKKLGLLALAGVFFLKFAKVIAVAAAVAGGSLFKFFRKKPADSA